MLAIRASTPGAASPSPSAAAFVGVAAAAVDTSGKLYLFAGVGRAALRLDADGKLHVAFTWSPDGSSPTRMALLDPC